MDYLGCTYAISTPPSCLIVDAGLGYDRTASLTGRETSCDRRLYSLNWRKHSLLIKARASVTLKDWINSGHPCVTIDLLKNSSGLRHFR